MSSGLDDIAPAFRAAANRWPEAPNIQAHYADIASTFENNGSSLIELCKSFLETICITIINELGGNAPANGSTTDYVVASLDQLGLRNTRGASAFDKVLSAYNKLADSLTIVRNQEGSVAHGKDGFVDAISDRHARVYLLSADTIIALLLQAYDGVEPYILKTREPHNRFSHHNERIDSATQVEAWVNEDGVVELSFRAGSLEDGFNIRVPASELLYYLDRRAYVDVLDALRGITTEAEEESVPEEEGAGTEQGKAEKAEKTGGTKESLSEKFEPVTDYQGKYADQVSPLYEFILHSLLNGNSRYATQVQNFAYTLLNAMEDMAVVDWSKRHSTRSEVRLFVKKLTKLFSLEGIQGNAIDQIVEWLSQHIEGEAE